MELYLTIDDAPSTHMGKKIDFLLAHQIPALFFCRGEFISKHHYHVERAIANEFLIGNHSYSHPYFSEISLEEIYMEILKNEELIDDCYRKAKSARREKVIRFPFGDRGGSEERVQKIQEFLKTEGFVSLGEDVFINIKEKPDPSGRGSLVPSIGRSLKPPPIYSPSFREGFIDVGWTFDPKDYKRKFIEDPEAYRKQLERHDLKSEEILILHDFDDNHHLFEITMDYLLNLKNIKFRSL